MIEDWASTTETDWSWEMYNPRLLPCEGFVSQGWISSVQSTLAPDCEIMIPTEQSFSCEWAMSRRTSFSGTSPSIT
jgi:hypothetical protein